MTGLRGFHRKRSAGVITQHQHLHLLSTLTTATLAGIVVLWRAPTLPNRVGVFAALCVVSGVAYSIAGVCNYLAVRDLKISVFQTTSKLSAFLPVVVFYFVLDESLDPVQLTGIVVASFPVFALAFVESNAGSKGVCPDTGSTRGFVFLGLYVLVTSALQIINAVTVKHDLEYSLGADTFLFLLCTNVAAIPVLTALIVRAKERVHVSRNLIRHGVIAGVLNFTAFGAFLAALATGPASTIVPMYAFNAFVSVGMMKAFPGEPRPKQRGSSYAVLVFLAVACLVAIALMIKGSVP